MSKLEMENAINFLEDLLNSKDSELVLKIISDMKRQNAENPEKKAVNL